MKKILVLLPDGVGVRNFVYSNFHSIGKNLGFEIKYWNNTPLDFKLLRLDSINIKNSKSHLLTDVYKNARKQVELNLFIKNSGDSVFNTYRFPFPFSNIKKIVKSILTKVLVRFNNTERGLEIIRSKINSLERKSIYYSTCVETLKEERPNLVFCTNQRPLTAVAPILAAKELGIPTACFIFSWDNLPKATMVVETDYYFVWSEFMRQEILKYYPYIKEDQVFVTGTPQFENHFENSTISTREDFFKKHQLDLSKRYICYSGDDITTCPDDPEYLADVAEAVLKLNNDGFSLGIIFRRCPVDFSSRYNKVLAKYKDVIVSLDPIWTNSGNSWNTVMPLPEDMLLQTNTVAHTEMVVNLGSSMVFDYAAHNKACAFINYDVKGKILENWSVEKIYNYVHFRSMPTKDSVVWLNSKTEIAEKIKTTLSDNSTNVKNAQNWFEMIVGSDPKNSSSKIWETIDKIIK